MTQVYHFSVRWSVPHTEENAKIMKEHLAQNCDKYIFQAEYTSNNPHYQGYCHLKTGKDRPKTLGRKWNSTLFGVEVRVASTNGKEKLKGYCMKDDTRIAGPWADKKLYLGKDLWPESKMPAWQQSMLAIVSKEPDDRTMHWVYDPIGNNGKTKFCKYLVFKRNAVGLVYGHSGDVLNLVSKLPNRPIYAWNLTRAKPANLSELDLYSAMESVKDGFFVNLKYETKQVLMEPPHVIVFANHRPQLHQISSDRWKLWTIDNHLLRPI